MPRSSPPSDTLTIHTGPRRDVSGALRWFVANLHVKRFVASRKSGRFGLADRHSDVAERIDHRVYLGPVQDSVAARDPHGATVAEHHLTITAGGAFPIEPDLRPAVRAGLPRSPSGSPERVTVDAVSRSVTRQYPDGITVISFPDGRVTTRYADGGRAELTVDGTMEYRPAVE